MLTPRQIRIILEEKYGLCVGEETLAQIKRKISNISRMKMRLAGRCCKTGRRKSVVVKLEDLNW